jgi:hypothetical protein
VRRFPVSRLAWFAGIALAPAGLAGACDEHFPTPPPPTAAPPSASSPPSIVPPSQRKNASSSRIVFDPVRGGVWTANGDVGSISYVDVDARVARSEPSVGGDITSVALSPDAARVAAADHARGIVTLFDAESITPLATVAVGGHPHACVWDSANPRWLYVSIEDGGTVAVVDGFLAQVAATIPVGRLPAGLAVSASQRELYVAHRIDATLTVVDLHDRSVGADIPLADEPFSAPKTPNGKPFAFEAPALTSDGNIAWLPHELLAPTHPFVFDETLFPAISVVDLSARVEVQTNPNLPNTAGRKNLFDAINLFGADGQPQVFSQPCAVALHPNGFIGWALACGSEDVITFDVGAGVATDALRNLPVDHPVGMTLDDTGKRLFVLGDQSHGIVTFDTGNGSLVQHTQMYGDQPIPTLQRLDPVDPALREGLRLFFRANSAKGASFQPDAGASDGGDAGDDGGTGAAGPLATTANNWMSCAGCHLDGFTSTNARFFEALVPADPGRDALIGHAGLVDHFSTAVSYASAGDAGADSTGGTAPDSAPFNPHDLLVALREQGGLATDRTGRTASAALDPDNPTAEGITMAQQLAAVVVRDLPAQPTWEQAQGNPAKGWDKYVVWDADYCGGCHAAEYQAWSKSVHALATSDEMVSFCRDQEPQFIRQCEGCHDPIVPRAPQPKHHGVTCLGCHDVEREMRAGGNADLVTVVHDDWGPKPDGTVDHKARALASLATLRQPEFCGGCHQQFVPGNGFGAIATFGEYHATAYAAAGTRCIDCHMRKDANGVANHRFPGGNVFLAQSIGDAGDETLEQEQRQNLAAAVQLKATRVAGGVQVVVSNIGAGHSFPTGVVDLREPWVEVQGKDPQGNPATYGGPGSDGLLPPSAARLGTDFADAGGGVLLLHELSAAARVPFDLRVPAGAAQSLFVPVEDGASSLTAVLYYRNVRTTYYRAALKLEAGSAPDVEVARAQVEMP